MKMFWRWVTSLFFPNRCYMCGDVIDWQQHICRRCYDKVPYILPPICARCGRSKSDCVCHGHKRSYERCISPLYYDDELKTAIYQLKTYGYRQVVDSLAMEMAEVIRREYGGVMFDAIVPIPLHKSTLSARGFNQSDLLARSLSTYVHSPVRPVLKKLYATKPQKTLTMQQRSGNLLGAFDVIEGESIDGATVLLVDDIVTTGSTLDECAKMLKLYGAKEVYAVTAAAAHPDRDNR